MDVLVMDSNVFRELQSMFKASCEIVEKLSKENEKLRYELWTPQEVATLTKYDVKTILRKKEEIGFITLGKDIRFEPDAVKAYFQANAIRPRKNFK